MTLAHRRRGAPGVSAGHRGERGSVLVVVSISLVVVVVCTALTVDLGRVSTLRRDLQNVADAATLDLVRLVDGRTAGTILADPRWAATQAASLDRNDFVPGGDRTVTVRLGAYDATAEVFTPVPSAATIPSAVEVAVTDRVEHAFAPGGTTTTRRAVAGNAASAGIQVGSFAARLDAQQSALLAPLVTDAVGVSLVGYEGLAGGRVGLAALATELGLSLASPDELLATEVSLVDLAAAQAAVLRRDGDLARADLLDALALQIPGGHDVALGDLIGLGAGGTDAAGAATVDVLEMLTGAAWAINGDRALDIPGLSLGVPGVATTGLSIQIVEGPRIVFGGPGATVQTAQVRLTATLDLTAVGLVGTRLEIGLQVAPSTATIREVSCGDPDVLGVDVTTGLAHADATLAGRIAISLLGLTNVPVADVVGEGETGRPGAVGSVDFVLPPDALGVAKPYSSGALDLAGLVVDTEVDVVPTAQLPLLLRTQVGAVTAAAEDVAELTLAPLVDAALAGLDATVVQPLLTLLGIALPGADITPLAIRCSGARLLG